MKIGLHGGDCCGVKHIHGLCFYPAGLMSARKATKMTSFGREYLGSHNDMRRANDRQKHDFFNEAAPMESYKERFERFVKFIKDNRPHGIIEVILNGNQSAWIPVLTKAGFTAGPSGKNSNTGSTITIYHLVH